jgi:hypothetical protein
MEEHIHFAKTVPVGHSPPSTHDVSSLKGMQKCKVFEVESTPPSTDDEGSVNRAKWEDTSTSGASCCAERRLEDLADELNIPTHRLGFFSHAEVLSKVDELLVHYRMKRCLISLVEAAGTLSTAACYRRESGIQFDLVALPARTRLCKMEAKRNLPTIIDDIHKHKTWCYDPLVVSPMTIGIEALRFFLEIPLMNSLEEYCGVICLADNEPRQRFHLDEAEVLMSKRVEIMQMFNS